MTSTVSPSPKLLVPVAQLFISGLMALMMTFVFAIALQGFPPGWPKRWLMQAAVAWPVAFVLSLVVGPVAFRLAGLVLRLADRRGARSG